nr:RNA-directed DNA polymerase, eukaryota [Tanacetum cinerariifolium]
MASGLSVNFYKSYIMGVVVPINDVEVMASLIGCKASKFPVSYLGVQVGDNMNKIEAWRNVVNKITNKLSSWKVKTLSVGGRLTLLKSVLGALPTYYMSIYKAPQAVISSLEALRNKFFIGAKIDERRMTWISWKKVLAHKQGGGLGVNSIYALNHALLFKWIWILRNYPNALWVQVVKAIHGEDERKRQGFTFDSFRRHPRGGVESTQWEEILDLLNSIILSSMADRWVWTLHGGEPTNWCTLIPIKVNVISWRISLDKLPTRMNLDARYIDVPSVLCPICGEYSENDEEDAETNFSSLILLLMMACVGF